MLSLEDARDRLLAAVRPVTEIEVVPLRDGLDRILAEDLLADRAVPPADNSAMDGYALRCADWPAADGLVLAGTATAGAPFKAALPAGQCVRIMTGAWIPAGCDTVIMQEECDLSGQGCTARVQLQRAPRAGENIRRAGEDIAVGAGLLDAGRRLRPADLGLLASLGLSAVEVLRRPRVALLSTGSELREPGEPLAEGQIYDSNRYLLTAMLRRLDLAVTDLGICADTPERLQAVLESAARDHDVVIASGGVSVGEADHTRRVLDRIGRVDAYKVAMKPGKPFTFGTLGDALFLGLPGNPVSATVTFHQLALPALRHLAGERSPESPLLVSARAGVPLRKKPGRADFQRAVLFADGDGGHRVETTGSQGSGVLSSVTRANAFIRLEAERGDVAAGDTVSVLPFDRWLM
ncbi:MAG: molybdopterin molybdotransferase [Alloalcanivorax sp.]|jgi:molybdopterin molybdotransferase